jgi:hypothetical protein
MVDAFLGTTSGVLRLHDGALEPLGLDGHSVTALTPRRTRAVAARVVGGGWIG